MCGAALLELAALWRTVGEVRIGQLYFLTDLPCLERRIRKLLLFLYPETKEDIRSIHKGLCLRGQTAEIFLAQSGYDRDGRLQVPLEALFARLQREEHARAYLRGAFLGAGTINDPHRSYHWEIALRRMQEAPQLEEVFRVLQISVKKATRRGIIIFYLKDSEAISDILYDLGAAQSKLIFEDVRVYKSVRNDVNRQVNAETANVDKQVKTGTWQKRMIEELVERDGWDGIPTPLQDVARARLAYPGKSFRELGELLTPPLGKSSVQHRLKKLVELAQNRGIEVMEEKL